MRTCRTRGWARLCVMLAASLTAEALPAAAQTTAPPAVAGAWALDAVAGIGKVSPDDLNARAAYDATWLNYLRAAQITQEHSGDIRELKDTLPVSVRLTKRIRRNWSVGGGMSVVFGRQASSEGATYRYTVTDPKAQEYQRTFAQSLEIDPLEFEVRTLVPHGLLGFDIGLGRRVRLGGLLAAGWGFAKCTLRRSSISQGGFYVTNHRDDLDMTGEGSGPSADLLLTGRLALTSRVGLLLEGGFAWLNVHDITGTLDRTQRIQDGEATSVELEQASRSEGRWVNQAASIQTSSGTWKGTVPSIGAQGAPLTLSLSGWQFRAGVSFGF